MGLKNWSDFEALKNALAKIGYKHEGDKGITGRQAFCRDGTVHNKILDTIDHHLYVCSVDNEEYQRHILFRNYLRTHTQARDRYNQIKEEILANVGSDNRAGYDQMKEEEYRDFFEDIIEKAENDKMNLPIDIILHSPLSRASDTARIINLPLSCEPRLIEHN